MDIGIVGAGVGGLAAAAFLARSGHMVTVFDKFDAPKPVGSGLVVQPVGLRVLESLGAAQYVEDHGARLNALLGYEMRRGRKVLDVSYTSARQEDGGIAVHRACLFASLMNVATRAGAHIEPGAEIAHTQVTAGKRLLRDAQGRHRGAYDLVIDASGAGSAISPLMARALAYGAVWATVDWPANSVMATDRLEQRYAAATHMAGVLPVGILPGGSTPKAAVFWSLRQNEFSDWKARGLDAWKTEAVGLWPEIEPFVTQIEDPDDMVMARYSHGTLRRMHGERIVHIGDAAHRASPQIGQGANMALLDAYALGECLNTLPLPLALSRFEQSRRRHIWVYQLLSAVFTPMYQSDSRALPALRDHLLTPATAFPGAGALLRWIVRGELVPPVVAGIRPPGR